MPGGGSSLDKLLKAWGVQFEKDKVVADLNFKVKTMGPNNQPVDAPAFLALDQSGINTNDVSTSEIHDIWYAMGGVFTGTPVAGLKETVLLKTTKESQLVDGMMASFSVKISCAISSRPARNIRWPSDSPASSKPLSPTANQKIPRTKLSPLTNPPTKRSRKPRTTAWVVLFGDADMLADQFSLRQRQTIFGRWATSRRTAISFSRKTSWISLVAM